MPAEFYDEDGFRLSFENDTSPDERQYFMRAFPNVSKIAERRIHCTTCNAHIGTAPVSEAVIRMHPVLRVTHCRNCHAFYNSGDFDKGEDGSELYCRWCGQGGEVFCCSKCPYVFCKSCIVRNLSRACVQDIVRNENWHCFGCAPRIMWHLRAQHWALDNFIEKQKKEIKNQDLSPNVISALMKKDRTTCCPGKGQNRKSVNATATAPMITSPVSATKKTPAKRTYGDMSGKREGSMEGGARLEPVVSIPPLAHSILGQLDVDPGIVLPGNDQGDAAIASSSGSVGSPVTTSSSSGKAAGSKKPRKSSTPNSDSGQSARPSQAKKKRMAGNNEVVCTPDIMSMLSDDGPAVGQPQTTPSRPPIVTVGGKPLVPIAPKPAPYIDPATGSPMQMSGNGALPGPMSKVNVPKQKAILHHSIPRNLAVSVPGSRVSVAPIDHPEQVGPQTVRVSSTAPRQSTGGSAPMYHTFEGYQIDLQAASQQSTYRLPNGKLILVRKQTADGNAQNATEPGLSPVQPPKVAPGMSGPIPGNRLLNNNVTSVPPGAAGGPMVVRNGQEMRRVPATHAQRQQAMQHQQRVQMQMAQMAQQNDQYQQQFQRMQQRMDQRTTGQRAMAQRMQQQQQQQQQQLHQQLPQPGMYLGPAAPGGGGIVYPAAGGAAPAVVPVPVQQAPPSPAGNAQQPAILALLRGLVNGPHEETPLGSARKDFEAKMLAGAEICHHILGKIYSLTNSNPFKNIRNLRDLKELFIHLSYLMTYGIGRFKTLHERCVDDVKKMGFTKESDFVMMGERVNNRNPEDDNSEDDDDCEIIEQNTTVIEVDSDDEAASATGKEKAATEGAAGGSSAKKAPKTVAQPAAPKDGSANTLTVGEIVVTWKVAGVSDTPGQPSTPAQNDKDGPRAANTDNVAVAGEIVAPKKTTPAAAAAAAAAPVGEGFNENASHDTSDKDSSNTVEVTIEALNSSGTGNLSSSTETVEMMETEANNSVTDSEGPVVSALPNKLTATQTPEVESLGNEDIDLGAADKDEVEMIEISDKEVSELLDIHASSNAATEKDAQSDQKDESIEITDSDDAGQNGGCTETSETGKEAAENATTGTADDTVETLSDDKSADAELDASEQKADDATTCTDKASLPDDMEQSSKESSSEVLDLMDAADDSYHSDSSDIQFGAECDAPDSAATHKDGNAGESSSVKNSEPKTGESEKNKPSLPSETKKGETVESTNEAEVSKQQEKQAVEPSAVIDLDASSTESDGNKSATEEDADASKKGDDESTKQDDTATKNESVASKQQEKSEAAAEPSAIIDLDASSTESYDNKSATEEDVDASNKDSDPAVQEEISEICTNESIDESLMTDPVELQTAGVEVNDNKEESTDIAKVQEVAEEIEEVVGEKVDTTFDGSSELQSQEKETPDDSAEAVECQPAEKLVSSEDDVVSAETSSKPVNSNSEPMDTEDGQLSSNDAEVMDITEEQEWPSSSHGKESTEMDASEGMEQEAKDLPNTEHLQLAEVEVVDSSLMSADSSSITNNNKPTASDSDNEKEGQLPPSQSTGELSSESSNATPVVNSIVSKKVEAAADNSSNEREESEADELFTTPPDLAELAPSSMEVDSSNLNSEP